MSRPRVARRAVMGTLAAVGWYLASCRDVPAPEGGVVSISPLILPSPGLVAGDTMRDSTGIVAPVRFIAYGPDGEPVDPQPASSFLVLDTTAHFAGALLIGDHTGTARIAGVLGAIQTAQKTVKVTLTPDTLVATDSVLHRVSYSLTTGDTVVNSAELGVRARHLLPTPSDVEAVVVRYAITRAPVGASTPTLVLADGNRLSARDTTDASGRAARGARLRLAAFSTFATDTAMVTATASYRGRVLGLITFTIIFTRQ